MLFLQCVVVEQIMLYSFWLQETNLTYTLFHIIFALPMRKPFRFIKMKNIDQTYPLSYLAISRPGFKISTGVMK